MSNDTGSPAGDTAHAPHQQRERPPPVATIIVLSITALLTAWHQVFDPRVLEALRRNPEALSAGQWWRVLSPIFVQAEGWPQIAFNFTSIPIVGVIVERIFGSRRWLLLYFLPGLVGEAAGYAWKPYGAGSSVGGAGLLGALCAALLMKRGLPVQARLGAAGVLAGAVVLTALRDLHGPPILAGACLGAFILQRGVACDDAPGT